MKEPDKKTSAPLPRSRFLYVFLALWMALLARDFSMHKDRQETLPYNQFKTYLKEQRIESVLLGQERIEGELKSAPPIRGGHFFTQRLEDPKLVEDLTTAGIRFEAVNENTFFKGVFSWLFPIFIMMAFWWFLSSRMSRTQGQFMTFGKSNAKVYVERDLKIRFDDVAGVEEAKFELSEVVEFLKDPSRYGRLGGRMPKGLLLVGPPGTGKTLLAKAVAGEANVPFFSINGSEFVEMFVGLGAARVRDLFVQARSQAPCIIFIDELDALGKARGLNALSGGANDEKEQTLNQLLAELDGFDSSQGVILLAATNRPEVLDAALLRSGRFDRQIVIDKADRKGRAEIIKIHLKKIHVSPDVDPDALASITAGFSGADLENLVNEAALIATRRNALKVEQRDFTGGVERIVGGLERKSRVLSSSEKRRVAFHEMGHTTVSLALDQGETVHKVSIIPRGVGALGYTMRRPTEDRYLISRNELKIKLAILLGGRAAEQIFLSDISTGAADDLDQATDIARSMVTRYGMSEKLGLLTYDREGSHFLGAQTMNKVHDYSDETAQTIDHEVVQLVDDAFKVACQTIEQFRAFIESSARVLLDKETLDENDIKELWSARVVTPGLVVNVSTASTDAAARDVK